MMSVVSRHAIYGLFVLILLSLPVQAFFEDTEISELNLLTSGMNDIAVVIGDWDDSNMASDVQPDQVAKHDIQVDTESVLGNGEFSYRIWVSDSDDPLCSRLFLALYRDGTMVDSGVLADVDVSVPVASPIDNWSAEIMPIADSTAVSGTCFVTYHIESRQSGLAFGQGFYDVEVTTIDLATSGFFASSGGEGGTATSTDEGGGVPGDGTGTSTDSGAQPPDDSETPTSTDGGALGGIVLNEIAGDAIIGNVVPLQGKEWVEIYNLGDEVVDVDGWQVSEIRGSKLAFYTIRDESEDNGELYTLEYGTDIAPGDYLTLVFVASDRLNNNGGDTVTLYLPDGETVVDKWTYAEAVKETSEGRIPDGTGDWVETERTPGEANTLPVVLPEV